MSIDVVQQESPLILVVDDDKSMRMLLRLALEQQGYIVLEAEDGEECLAVIQRRQPDAIAAYKLESLGLIQLEGDLACASCELYHLYFRQQLRDS